MGGYATLALEAFPAILAYSKTCHSPFRRVHVSRFIRSALFPILIVVILALFINWAINRSDEPGLEYTYQGQENSFVS